MFSNPHFFDRLRQTFADQFEPDDGDFLYRKSMKGAAIRVSSDERDEFTRTFNRRLRYAIWSMLFAALIVLGLLVWLIPDVKSTAGNIAVYAGIALIMFPFLAVYSWAWNTPARELEDRPEAGAARSQAEVRQMMFSKMTYGNLGLAVLAVLVLLWKASAHTDVFHGWGRLWLVFAGLLIAGVGIQAFRKWQFESSRAR